MMTSSTVELDSQQPRRFENARQLFQCVVEDVRGSNYITKAMALGGAAVVFSHLAGAEVFLSNVGVREFTASGGNIWLTGLAVGGTSLAMETASTTVVSASTQRLPALNRYLMDRLAEGNKKEDINIQSIGDQESDMGPRLTDDIFIKPTPTKSQMLREKARDSMNSLLVKSQILREKVRDSTSSLLEVVGVVGVAGSPGYIAHEYSKDPRKNFKDNFKTGAKAIGGLAVFNTALGTGVAAAIRNAQKIGPIGEKITVTGFTHSYLDGAIPQLGGIFPEVKSPLFWATAFSAGYMLRHRFKRNKDAESVSENTQQELSVTSESSSG